MIDGDTPISRLSPREFELAVKGIVDRAGAGLASFETTHLARVEGADGEYVIDVLATFEALDVKFQILIECKHERRPVERQDVQVLKAKMDSTGSQKGLLFSIAGFQSGAQEYASAHGIALAQLVDGRTLWHTRAAGQSSPPPPWINLPKYAAWWWRGSNRALLAPDYGEYTRELLGLTRNALRCPRLS